MKIGETMVVVAIIAILSRLFDDPFSSTRHGRELRFLLPVYFLTRLGRAKYRFELVIASAALALLSRDIYTYIYKYLNYNNVYYNYVCLIRCILSVFFILVLVESTLRAFRGRAVQPFFSLRLVARRWPRFRARYTRLAIAITLLAIPIYYSLPDNHYVFYDFRIFEFNFMVILIIFLGEINAYIAVMSELAIMAWRSWRRPSRLFGRKARLRPFALTDSIIAVWAVSVLLYLSKPKPPIMPQFGPWIIESRLDRQANIVLPALACIGVTALVFFRGQFGRRHGRTSAD